MAKAELGTKRTDPETGKKFYDLNRDPVVSPYSGKSWPLSFFEETAAAAAAVKEVPEEEEVAEVDAENPEVELVSLEEADEAASGDDIPDDIGDDDVEIDGDDDEDDTFLAPDEDDEDDDMSDIIGVTGDDDDV